MAEEPKKGIRRNDPEPRPVEGLTNRNHLERKDPTKHYVWVSELNDPTINVASYLAQGYHVSRFDPDEARPSIGYHEYKQGDPIKSLGMVLMEAPIERKREIDERGWKQADAIQETIRKRDLDPLTPEERRAFRGITSVRGDNDDRARWSF